MTLNEGLALLVIAAVIVWGFGFKFWGLPGRKLWRDNGLDRLRKHDPDRRKP
jgi:hypothetical protein